MKKKKLMYRVLVLVMMSAGLIFQSCENPDSWKETDSGLEYKYITKGEGVKGDSGMFLMVNMLYKTDTDSVLFTTADRGESVPVPVPGKLGTKGIEEAFTMCSEGDSLVFRINSHELFTETFKSTLPPFIDSASSITFEMGIESVLDQEGFSKWQAEMSQKMMADQKALETEQLAKDRVIIEEYLTANNINAQQTESGISYVITKQGKGDLAKAGQTVSVDYAGYLLDGRLFDSSIEAVVRENQKYREGRQYIPYEFVLGTKSVIEGWNQGIALLSKGGKATLYIPSYLAYGPRRRSEEIIENSILIFNVELVDLK